MKIIFWKKNKNIIKKTISRPVWADQENKDKVLEKGADDFSKKFTKTIERLSNE
ncbi:MAG: hypothetical protein WCI93_03670 [bacterium]